LKILKQEKLGNQVSFEIEEEYSKLEPEIEKAYAEASREVKIPGFRQGKAPADLLKKYIHEEAVMDRAVQFLFSEIYPEIITSSGIKPVDYPGVELKKLAKNSPLIFTVKVDVYPEIKLGNYRKLSLVKRSTEVADADIDKTIGYIKQNYSKQANVPEDELVLDDEFAKKVSQTGTLQELKDLIKTNLQEEKKREAELAERDDVTKKLSELVEGRIPGGMVEREIDSMVHDLEISLQRNRMTVASYLSATQKDLNKLREEIKPSAEIRLKAKLALEQIAEKEKLEVGQGDIDKEIEVLAQHYGKTADEYKKEVSSDMIESMKEFMLREKAIDFVISKAKVEG
jgi:FKBP-type peptidyl-prolyl cis-trans isomerase (trigger factor)